MIDKHPGLAEVMQELPTFAPVCRDVNLPVESSEVKPVRIVRVDLHVPFPAATVVERGRHGPFYRRSKEWSGLENPGLLGVTLGAGDPRALSEFLGLLGVARMKVAEGDAATGQDSPLLAGDHQLRLERREPPGIYGAAYVVAAARLPDLVRTLERFGAQHRLDRNHLLAVDPAGRILAVNGVRAA